jgi:hypothetical protein
MHTARIQLASSTVTNMHTLRIPFVEAPILSKFGMRDLRSDYPLETTSLLLAFYVVRSYLPLFRFVRDCNSCRGRFFDVPSYCSR